MKTIGIFQMAQKKFDLLPFEGPWFESFGKPEKNFSCLIFGHSGQGKTDFCVKLAKYLSQFDKVLYLSAEEGISSTIQEAFNRNCMMEVSGKVILGSKANIGELISYLKQRNSPGFVFIDSSDYMRLTREQFVELTSTFPRKSFIITSWRNGKQPQSQAARDIEYMADIKILVHEYVAHMRSRFGGNAPFMIWQAGHERKVLERTGKKMQQNLPGMEG